MTARALRRDFESWSEVVDVIAALSGASELLGEAFSVPGLNIRARDRVRSSLAIVDLAVSRLEITEDRLRGDGFPLLPS